MSVIKLITTSSFTTDTVALPASLTGTANAHRVDVCILEAQQVDLKPLLGYALYNEVLQKAVGSSPVTAFVNLLNGETYTDPTGYSVVFQGLKMALIYWTMSRLVMRNQVSITSHGVQRKTSQYSESVDAKVLAKEADGYFAVGNSYWQDAKKYLDDKASVFPKWNATPRDRSVSPVRFSAIGSGYMNNQDIQNKDINNCNDCNK